MFSLSIMESFSYTVDVGIDVLSKDQLQALLLGSPDIITVFDRNGVILYISPAIEAVTGFAPEELVAQEMLSFVHPYEQRLIRQRFGGLVQAEASKPIQFRFCAKSGKYIWLETVGGNQLTNEALGGVVAYLRDIGERKRMEEQIHLLNHTLEQRVVDRTRELATANEELELQIQDRNTIEAALRENGRLLDLIFTTANIGLAVSDEEGRFVHINPMYCTIVGYESAEQLLGKPYFSLLPLNEEAEARALYGRFITGDDTATLRERTVVRSDGIKLDVLTSAARLVRENGQVFVISALADISERMQAERRLEMALLELKAVYQALPDLYFRLDSEGYYLT